MAVSRKALRSMDGNRFSGLPARSRTSRHFIGSSVAVRYAAMRRELSVQIDCHASGRAVAVAAYLAVCSSAALGEIAMADAEIAALRAKLASRSRSDDYRQRRRDIDARGLAYGLPPDVKLEPVNASGMRANGLRPRAPPPMPQSFTCMAAAM